MFLNESFYKRERMRGTATDLERTFAKTNLIKNVYSKYTAVNPRLIHVNV